VPDDYHEHYTVLNDDDDTVLARAATLSIILAAWHEAVRTTPGTRLTLKNGTFQMERLRTPGDKKSREGTLINGKIEPFDAALGDLRSWHRLRIMCLSCSRNLYAEALDMAKQHGKDRTLRSLEKRMRCKGCGGGHVRLEVHNKPR